MLWTTNSGHSSGTVPCAEIIPPAERRILFVEPEGTAARAAEKLFQGSGFRLDIAANTTVAFQKIMADKFDVILCDAAEATLQPEVFYHAVKRMKPELADRFIMVLGGQSTSKLFEFIQVNGIVTIYKPFDFSCLREKMESILNPGPSATRAFCWWDSKRLVSPEIPVFLENDEDAARRKKAEKAAARQAARESAERGGTNTGFSAWRNLFFETIRTSSYKLQRRFRAEWKLILLEVVILFVVLKLAEILPYKFYDPSRTKPQTAAPAKKAAKPASAIW